MAWQELRRAKRATGHLENLEQIPAGQMGLTPDQLLITTGSQQALYLIGDCLIDPGDIVIAAAPSYFVFTGTLDSLGASVLTVPMDEDGMGVEAVGRLLERLDREGRLPRVKFVYCTSYYQNPTGLTLAADRRPRLLEIVRKFSREHRILILEDAAYRELRYDGPAHRSIKSYDPDNRYTILSQTFSKPFAPGGWKLGYTFAPDDLLHAMLQQKGNHDFGSSNVTQHMALESFADGSYRKHGEVLRKAYRVKRDAMLASLQHFMPPDAEISWTHPHGGLYVWLTLPREMDTAATGPMFGACVDNGVLYVPGEYCFQRDPQGRLPKNHIRLSFGQVAPDQIEPGIQRLAEVVRRQLDGGPSANRLRDAS